MININSIITASRVNGPGTRCVLWTQGCSLKCPGCFNSDLQAFKKARFCNTDKLARYLALLPGAGLTVSGGEPFDQPEGLNGLLKKYKDYCEKTIIIFTGYEFHEIKASGDKMKTALLADALISGRYKKGPPWADKRLVLLTGRLKAEEMRPEESIELIFSADKAIVTGYPPDGRREIRI